MNYRKLTLPLAAACCTGLIICNDSVANPPEQTSEIAHLRERLARVQTELDALRAQSKTAAEDTTGGLASEDAATGREAVTGWAKKGPGALPRLREIAFENDSAAARHRAKEAIGQITGQWGSQTDLVWKRSVEEAINPDKPIVVLQLFGNLDEEFC